MTCDMDDLMKVIASETFIHLMDAEQVQFTQFVAAESLLIKNRVPFDAAYTPGTRRGEAEFTLTAYITPKLSMKISFSDLDLTDSK